MNKNISLSVSEFDSDAQDKIVSSGQSPDDFYPLLQSDFISDEIKNLIFKDVLDFCYDLKREFLELNQERIVEGHLTEI